MSVYGQDIGTIDISTPLNPKDSYGSSKLHAEKLIKALQDDSFEVAIIRPPMVYGAGCKGNYPRLVKLTNVIPIFPDIKNKRSMIHIDNLCELARLLIDDNASGLFLPQNNEYVNTSEMGKLISEIHGKKIYFTKTFNPLIKLCRIKAINKMFGDLVYKKELSEYKKDYRVRNLEESLKLTEKDW